jgi:hypothetical protein
MRIGFLALCVLGLTVGLNGQAGTAPAEARWQINSPRVISYSRPLPDGKTRTAALLQAQSVEIRIGNTVITADQASVDDWLGATGPVEIALTGNVRVRTVLDPLAQ